MNQQQLKLTDEQWQYVWNTALLCAKAAGETQWTFEQFKSYIDLVDLDDIPKVKLPKLTPVEMKKATSLRYRFPEYKGMSTHAMMKLDIWPLYTSGGCLKK